MALEDTNNNHREHGMEENLGRDDEEPTLIGYEPLRRTEWSWTLNRLLLVLTEANHQDDGRHLPSIFTETH